ncbi:MAG: DEAD/DEAH box helicase [Prevotellaceae bacterium]|jgi:superfamily II DNA or RNA helicase|nr:DEAD/DEAH box helicase [Prevotellaceae bacterium]
MIDSLIKNYASLSDNRKNITNIAALLGNFTTYEIGAVIQKFYPAQYSEIKQFMLDSATHKFLTMPSATNYSMNVQFMVWLYPKLGNYVEVMNYIDKNIRAYVAYSFYFQQNEVYKAFRQALFCLLFGSDKQYADAEKKITLRQKYDIYNFLLDDPQYQHVLKRISGNVLESTLNTRMGECIKQLNPLSTFIEFVNNLNDVSVIIRNIRQTARVRNILFRGDLSEFHLLSDASQSFRYKAIESALEGHMNEAVLFFDKDLRMLRQQNKLMLLPAEYDAAYIYLTALMCIEPDKILAVCRKICEIKNRSAIPKSIDMFDAVVRYMVHDKERLKYVLEDSVKRIPLSDPMTSLYILLVHGLCHVQMLTDEHIDILKAAITKALNSGYTVLANEAAWALKTIAPDAGKELYAQVAARAFHPPMMSRIRYLDNWEKALNILLELNPKRKSTKWEVATRIAYFFNHKYLSIQPVLQTRSEYSGWSSGRNIAMKTFYEGKLDAMTANDRLIASTLEHSYSVYRPSGKTFLALIGNQNIMLEGTVNVPVDFVSARPQISVMLRDDKYVVESEITDKREIEMHTAIKKETNTRYRIINITDSQRKIIEVINDNTIEIPEKRRDRLLELLGYLASEGVEVHSDIMHSGGDDINMRIVETDSRIRVQLLPFGNKLKAELFCKPFGTTPPYCKPANGGRVLIYNDNEVRLQVERNFECEKEYEQMLMQDIQAIEGINISPDGLISLDNTQYALDLLHVLNQHTDICVIEWPEGERLKLRGAAGFSGLNIEVRSSSNWFELQGELKVDENLVVSIMDLLLKNDRSHGRFIELSRGEFLMLSHELKNKLDELRVFSANDKQVVRVNRFASVALSEFFDKIENLHGDSIWYEFTERLRNAATVDATIPNTLQTELRTYQEEGFRWMARLADLDCGACLADDMGLGKTVQTLTLLLHRSNCGAALVVCPVSVVGNWINEAARFTPDLSIKTLANTNRAQTVAELKAGDILITSYGLLQSEEQLLASYHFATIVLDEAHTIKNFATKTSKATMNLQASFRMALTGTPIQNRLSEIWNIFNFLNPGLLGSIEHFGATFIRNDDEMTRKRLKQLITPFILRRTKATVLSELPPKTEIVKKITLSEQERAFYEALRRNAIELIKNSTDQTNNIRVLAEITRLRQACCSPLLVDPSARHITSSKLAAFIQIIEELKENNHRAIVFSQFVAYLNLVRTAVIAKSISYQYLDGSTSQQDRERRVKAFQDGEGALFLISLKAGGLGLNLTAADYVIHLDPWWNPAIEDQASDRAHRIGQTRPVTIYRFVAENTIEEKIIQLHETKRDLAESLLEGSDRSASLSIAEMIELITG